MKKQKFDYGYKQIDAEMAFSLVKSQEPWSVITKLVGASRQTILHRLADLGYEVERRPGGRPPSLSPLLIDMVVALFREGHSDSSIARDLKVPVQTITDTLNRRVPERSGRPADEVVATMLEQIVGLASDGLTTTDISNLVNTSRQRVYQVLRRYAPHLLTRRPRKPVPKSA